MILDILGKYIFYNLVEDMFIPGFLMTYHAEVDEAHISSQIMCHWCNWEGWRD